MPAPPDRRSVLLALKSLQHAHERVLRARSPQERDEARKARKAVRDRILAAFDALVATQGTPSQPAG